MTFLPALPLGGYAGWVFLKRTQPRQEAAMGLQPAVRSDEAYFREKIGKIDTAEQLVSDRRLLRITLGAFGLEGDIQNKAFIRKVLDDGTLNPESLANRLADKQYQKLSAAFGFGDFATPRNKLSDFSDRILSAWKARQFETAVGQQNDDLRLALNAERELSALSVKSTGSNDAKWFSVLGNAPLRRVFEKSLGLPSSFGQLDIDRQLEEMKDKARNQFGTDNMAELAGGDRLDGLLRRFLVRSEAEAYRNQFGSSTAVSLMAQAVVLSRQR